MDNLVAGVSVHILLKEFFGFQADVPSMVRVQIISNSLYLLTGHDSTIFKTQITKYNEYQKMLSLIGDTFMSFLIIATVK